MTTAKGTSPQTEQLPLILAAVAVVAVVIPAGLLGGALAATVTGLPDVGPLVRSSIGFRDWHLKTADRTPKLDDCAHHSVDLRDGRVIDQVEPLHDRNLRAGDLPQHA